MKAMATPSCKSIDDLMLVDLSDPTPAKNEVRVRVRGSSINPIDYNLIKGNTKLLHGKTIPLVVGYDFSGEVDAIGEGVSEFKVGERVFGFLAYSGSNYQGAFAEKIVANVTTISKAPASISDEEAGSCPTSALTALRCVRMAMAGSTSKTILVNGASGGVGTYAIQIAHLLGAKVSAVCSESSAEYVKSLGAEIVVDYQKTPISSLKERYGAIFDVASNLSFFKTRHLLEPRGQFITLLPSVTTIGGILLSPFLSQKCSMILVKSVAQDMKQIAQWIDERKLKTPVEKTFPLNDLAAAFHRYEKGSIKGKIAISISGV
jgi:NADPH:quinone reductase